MRGLLALGLLCGAVFGVNAADRPNVLLIMADDLGYADVSFAGGKDIPTPNIDRIAKEGAFFSQFYVTQAFCAPSRAGVLTGRYPQRFGMDNNPRDYNETDGMPASEITLAEVLRDAGYRTGLVGKWHLGAGAEHHPNNQGFDEFYGTVHGGHRYFPIDPMKVGKRWRFYADSLERNGEHVPHEKYITDQFTDAAVAFLEQPAESPFFLFLSYNAPHTPLEAPEELRQEFAHLKDPKRQTYAAMVRALDNGVGRVLDLLEQKGLAKNTIVLFMSDNGGRTDQGAVNAPFKGRKGDPYEGGVRVPCALRWPGTVSVGNRFDETVSSLDLFPMLVHAAGAEVPAGIDYDGRDLAGFLEAGTWDSPRDLLFWRQLSGERIMKGIRQGDWKWGITRFKAEFLYNVADDPHEKNNYLALRPELAGELKTRFEKWSSGMKDPAWVGE